jgi:hypothetical protein
MTTAICNPTSAAASGTPAYETFFALAACIGYVFRQTPVIVIPGLTGNMLADHRTF